MRLVQAQHLEEVLADKGAKFLETYRVPMLSWEEVKALKGPGLVGLGAPGGDPIGDKLSMLHTIRANIPLALYTLLTMF